MNQKRLVLHIGQTKTATTSIQDFLHSNQQQLELSNIYYARRPGKCISHRYLFHLICASIPKLQGSDFCNRHLTILKNLFTDYQFKTIEQYWQYFNDSLFGKECDASLLSEELLWEIGKFELKFKQEMIQVLAKNIHQSVRPENVTILVALRHHAEWLESWHNQMVKDQGNQVKIKPFLESEIKLGSFNYAKNLNDWREIFPKATFKVVDFKTSLVTPRPIGITFLEEANLLDTLKVDSIIDFIYPKPLQESIHPFLHAYIIRNKPAFNNLSEYKQKLKKANKIVKSLISLNEFNDSFTLVNPTIFDICNHLYTKDNLRDFGINQLKNSLMTKRQVPRSLPTEISEHIRDIFD